MLTAANQANQEQFERLLVFESAAVERLTALEATAANLRRQTAANSAMRSDLEQIASEATRAQALQIAEREHWQLAMAELRSARTNEHSARLIAEERLAELQLRSSQVSEERDQYLRATRELQLSEQQLTNQVLAIQADTLVQSIFRRLRQLF